MASYDYDVLVIGSGAGGSVAARLLAKAGKSVAMVESGKMGGECPNYACIPTKAILESAHLYHQARNGEELGLRGTGVGFNYPSVRAWKNAAVRRTRVSETESSLNKAGVNVIHGSAHFIDSHTISVRRARFKARNFIIATGAEPNIPNMPDLNINDYLTYKDALELNRPPRSIAIIGGGPVGIEFSTIFGSFGSKVCLIESGAHLLSKEDALVGKVLAQNLESQYDISVITNSTLKNVSKRGGKKQLMLKAGTHLHTVTVDEILFATGKTPNTDIGLENAGVKYVKQGILVNNHLTTSAPHIYGVGDVLGGYQFTHTSLYHGKLAAHNILHSKKPLSVNHSAVPRVVFSSPEVACVGLSTNELKKLPTMSSTADINTIGRSIVSQPVRGFVKVTAHKKSGRILSASIICPNAGEMIHELTLAIANHLTVADIANTLHAFPTWSEAIRVACSKLAKA